MSDYDRQKDIDVEGQRAAIWHAEKDGQHFVGYSLPPLEEVRRKLAEKLAADKDRLLHQALIDLGWTPPAGK